jgi:hypothetical protein
VLPEVSDCASDIACDQEPEARSKDPEENEVAGPSDGELDLCNESLKERFVPDADNMFDLEDGDSGNGGRCTMPYSEGLKGRSGFAGSWCTGKALFDVSTSSREVEGANEDVSQPEDKGVKLLDVTRTSRSPPAAIVAMLGSE